MQTVESPLNPSKRVLIVAVCVVIAIWGDSMAAAQLSEQRDAKAKAIAALAEVGGVLRYDNQGRPVWLAFRKAEREVDDAALANVAKLETLEEINFMPLNPGPLPRHRLVTDNGLVHLRRLPRLRALNLSNTGVRGPGLAQLHGNKELTSLKFLPPQQNLWVRSGSGRWPRLCKRASFATFAVRKPYDFLVTSFTLLLSPSTAPEETCPRARNQFRISGR